MTSSTDAPRTPVLSVRGLSVTYGRARVVDGFELDVPAGQVCVLMGPSGSGKTSILRALMGLVPHPGQVVADRVRLRTPDGLIDLAGADQRRWHAVRATHIGVVFQDAALALTPLRQVGSLLSEVARLRGLTLDLSGEDSGMLGEALRWAGFDDPSAVQSRRSMELSGGMAQRLALALAVAGRPRLLLADEPTTALDGLKRAELLGRLREYADGGAGVVVVTHDDVVARLIGDRVIDLHDVVELGLHSDTTPRPATPPDRPPGDPAAAEEVLALSGVHKAFPGTGPVLRGVDLMVRRGEIVGLVGLSGAGKSTIVRTVVGLEAADAGQVRIAGQQPTATGWRRLRRQVQLIPQDPRASLNPWRTARQAVTDPLAFHRIGTRASRRDRADALLAEVGLDGLGEVLPEALSTGQCQRVSLARALAVGPAVVVADEPVASLDRRLRDGVLDLLRDLTIADRSGVVVVSHDLAALERCCDRIAVLHDGVIVEAHPADVLRTAATHPLTRSLLACYPQTDDRIPETT